MIRMNYATDLALSLLEDSAIDCTMHLPTVLMDEVNAVLLFAHESHKEMAVDIINGFDSIDFNSISQYLFGF